MNRNMIRLVARCNRLDLLLLILAMSWAPVPSLADEGTRISLSMRDAELSEVMEMLSRQNRVNILMHDGVEADVSFNLYDVGLDQAIRSIAGAAGYAVEKRKSTYFILPEDKAGKSPGSGFTIVKALPVQYANPADLENILSEYASDYGKITALPERKMLIVEDRPGYVYRIETILTELDRRPRQVMIEAKVLEVSLSDEQSFGIDWTGFFDTRDGSGSGGTQGLSAPGNSSNAGFFFDYLHLDYEIAIRALESDGRVRNLASPKLVTIENEEAEVIIGDRRGYRVTTTINQVTTESIEFLESGVILRVTPKIDENGQILLDIHPEVSTGTVDENGIPSQTTTEVTTKLLVSSGQTIFIGGLMRNTTTESRAGVPVLGRIPGLRWLFSSRSRTTANTETVVLITPRLLDEEFTAISEATEDVVDEVAADLGARSRDIEEIIEDTFGTLAAPPADEPVEPAAVPNVDQVTTDAVEFAADKVVAEASAPVEVEEVD